MIDRIDTDELTAWRTFLTAHAAVIARIESELAEAREIALTWYDVLIELYEAPGQRLRLHELADAVVLSRSRVTRLIDRLEQAGLLTRQRDPTDGRGAYAVLTPEGHAALRRSWPIYAHGIREHFSRHLSEAETAALSAGLGRVVEALRLTDPGTASRNGSR